MQCDYRLLVTQFEPQDPDQRCSLLSGVYLPMPTPGAIQPNTILLLLTSQIYLKFLYAGRVFSCTIFRREHGLRITPLLIGVFGLFGSPKDGKKALLFTCQYRWVSCGYSIAQCVTNAWVFSLVYVCIIYISFSKSVKQEISKNKQACKLLNYLKLA